METGHIEKPKLTLVEVIIFIMIAGAIVGGWVSLLDRFL